MVKIKVKAGPKDEFIYETSTTESVDTITTDLATLHNLRQRVARLAMGVQELIKYGPMRPENERGLTESQLSAAAGQRAPAVAEDPTGIRVGQPVDAKVAITLTKTVEELLATVSPDLAARRKPLSIKNITEGISTVRGAVMMAYPMGLPDWDTVKHAVEDTENLAGQEASKYVLDVKTAVAWFSGKQMMRDDTLDKYLKSKNEKVTILVKLTKKGAGAPQREAAVDPETQKKMMAYWHKKQEVEKKLEEDDEDAYLNSEWANTSSFKKNTMGLGDIKWKPGF